MQLIFHGELRRLYGPSIQMACSSVADALEGFSRQQDNWPRKLRIAVAGFETEDKLRADTDETEVHVMPAIAGGGGKFGTILMGIALVAVALVAPISAALSTSLLVSGGLMIAQGVIQLFFKSPTVSKTGADPEASKYLGVNQNTTAVGTPIIIAGGRISFAPHWLSLQSDSSNLSYGVFPSNPT